MSDTQERENFGEEQGDRFDAAKERRVIEALLRKTRRVWERPVFVEGLLWYLTTLGAVGLSAIFAAAVAPDEVAAQVAGWIVRFGGGLSSAIAATLALRYWKRTPDLGEIALVVQRHIPELRSDVVSALQFSRELEEGDVGYSRVMAEEHVRRTRRTLLGMVGSDGSLAHRLPKRDAPASTIALSACLVVMIAAAFFAPDTVRVVFTGVGVIDAADGSADVRRPVVGDIDLVYNLPSYTGMPARFEAFSTGHIETLEGTEVRLRTYPILRAESYEIVVSTEDGTRAVPLAPRQGRLEATFLATKTGTYQFRATLADGTVIEDGIERTISLQPDAPPKVAITSHQGELEVSPEDVIEFEFSVSDDFGVESIYRAHAFAGDEAQRTPIDLPELANKPHEAGGTFALDLTSLSLQPKDVVVLHLEATDNNTLTGPGRGKSEEIVLRVASPEDKHMRIIAEEQEVMEALLEVLANYLENPVGERIPNAKEIYEQKVPKDLTPAARSQRFVAVGVATRELGVVLQKMGALAERMREDPLMLKRDIELFAALHEQLYRLERDASEVLSRHQGRAKEERLTVVDLQSVADEAARIEDALEKGLLRMEDLLATQKMDAIKATAEDIKELKDRLRELLEKYKETGDPELKAAIQREIKRLRQRMAELMARMQDQLHKLPEEHVNMEALESQQMESDARELVDEMKSIEDLLEQGDIDGALDALDRMGENLDSLTKEMDQQFDAAQPEGLSELDQKLSELMDQVNDLETLQQDVEQETSDVQEEAQAEQRRELEKMVEKFSREMLREVRDQQQDAAALEKTVPRFEERSVREAEEDLEDLESSLESHDLEEALQKAKSSLEKLRTLQFSVELSQRYARNGSREERKMQSSLKRLEDMVDRGHRINRELKSMMEQARQQLSKADQTQMEGLTKRQKQVRSQSDRLSKAIDEASQKFPMLQEQLKPKVDGAQQSMDGASESLQQRMMQRALDEQRSALEQLRELKESMQQTLQKERNRGKGRRQRNEKVEIPGKDDRTNKNFRQDVMKNMREGRLENYADEIERYYKSLME